MWNRVAPAVGLFFLAPFVGEFLLGNLPITMLPALIVLAPMYGGGALLIRELARRRDLGWPGIVLLGLAYAVAEEGLVTRSLFDRDFAGGGLLDYGWIPVLGMGSWWTVFVLTLHVAWSICVPVALAETLAGSRARTPWLGRVGLAVTSVLLVLGAAAAAATTAVYRPSVSQLAGTVIVVLLLIGAALLRGRAGRSQHASTDATRAGKTPLAAPRPWPVFWSALAAGSAFWLAAMAMDVLGDLPAALVVTGYLALAAATAFTVLRWSRRSGWGERHRLALAAGGLLTYAWHGFAQVSAIPVPIGAKLAGNTVFALLAVGLLALAVRRLPAAEAGVNPLPAAGRADEQAQT